ncbi:MAG: hypothetical protein ABI772_09990 [Bacteroidota bacterium]
MIQVFKYIDQLDCFIVDNEFKKIADTLGLTEWNEVVWIGRYFILDNDFGEHWFDNWDLREKLEEQAKQLGIDSHNLLIIDPERFKNDKDGPCHSDFERKKFWTDVLKSLKLDYETIFNEARKENKKRETDDEGYIVDLEIQIGALKKTFS